jgi:glycosyltransferase involved in cell wall biosynthesis
MIELKIEDKVSLSLIVPIFNDVMAISPFLKRINDTFKDQKLIFFEIIFVNDGSADATLSTLIESQNNDERIKIIDLSRNFGKEAALTAGLQAAKGDLVVPIDVDLQDPPELILQMISKWRSGFDVVLARRIDRFSDSWFKRLSAELFYYLNNLLSHPKLPENVGDFRLMSRCVVDAINSMPESCRFMKGLFSWVGFNIAYVEYSRPRRIAGKTKFNFWKLWNLALEGITSFSTLPLRIFMYFGFIVSTLSVLFAIFILVRVIIYGIDVPGYASLIIAITFIGGLQLLGIGVLGEYLGRTYIESKRRPLYIVRHIYESTGPLNGS